MNKKFSTSYYLKVQQNNVLLSDSRMAAFLDSQNLTFYKTFYDNFKLSPKIPTNTANGLINFFILLDPKVVVTERSVNTILTALGSLGGLTGLILMII